MLAGDIACVEVCTGGAHDVMYAAEDDVGLGIFARSFPPSFDDTCVVTKTLEVGVGAIEPDEGRGKEFETDYFCPSNVSSL